MHFAFLSLLLFVFVGCYVEAHDEHHQSSTLAPELSARKKREGPPHANPRERRSEDAVTDEKRQFPPNVGPEGSTPTPSRRKRHSESSSTTMVHPVLVEADAAAESIDNESESAGVKKREAENDSNASTEDDETTTPEGAVEKKDGKDDGEDLQVEGDQVSRAKRVSHAGSSHKNRPSAVNRLQSNSNVGGNEDEEPENDHLDHHEFELDSMHGY